MLEPLAAVAQIEAAVASPRYDQAQQENQLGLQLERHQGCDEYLRGL